MPSERKSKCRSYSRTILEMCNEMVPVLNDWEWNQPQCSSYWEAAREVQGWEMEVRYPQQWECEMELITKLKQRLICRLPWYSSMSLTEEVEYLITKYGFCHTNSSHAQEHAQSQGRSPATWECFGSWGCQHCRAFPNPLGHTARKLHIPPWRTTIVRSSSEKVKTAHEAPSTAFVS